MHLNLRLAILPALVMLAAPLRAQNSPSTGGTAVDDSARAVALVVLPTSVTDSADKRIALTPPIDLRAAAHYSRSTQAAAPRLFAPKRNEGQPIAFMAVGGAAIIVGAIIGGDAGKVFMVGGAVVGLIGLYQYLE